MFETPLTQFVGLAALRVAQRSQEARLSLDLLEEILIIATHIHLRLDGLEIGCTPLTDRVRYVERLVALRPFPVALQELQSGYFTHTETSIAPTAKLRETLGTLAADDELRKLQPYINELVGYASTVGVDAVRYLALTSSSDHGLDALVTDLQLMTKAIRDYAKYHFYVKASGPVNRTAILSRVDKAHSRVKSHLDILRRAPEFAAKIKAAADDPLHGAQLLNYARPLPENTPLFPFIAWLADLLKTVAHTLIGSIDDQQPDIHALSSVIAEACRTFSRSQPNTTGLPAHDAILASISALTALVNDCSSALLAEYDDRRYDRHATEQLPNGTTRPTVCYDIRKSGDQLEEVMRQHGIEKISDLDTWRRRLAAVQRNWAIVFDGTLTRHRNGDNQINLFHDSLAALYSLVFTMGHIRSLEHQNVGPLHYSMRAGIGIAEVITIGQQIEATEFNLLYRHIEALANRDVSGRPAPQSYALAPDSFVTANGLKSYSQQVVLAHGKRAHVLNDQQILGDFVQRLGVTA